MRRGIGLVPIEVELTLVPGLPQMKFLGLPDAVIRESEIRIRSALRNQGFELPKAQQIVVQLRPSDERKHSRGLDLAVAAAYLWETGQIPKRSQDRIFLYGELDFQGQVKAPSDVEDLDVLDLRGDLVLGSHSEVLRTSHLRVNELRSLTDATQVPAVPKNWEFQIPEKEGLSVPQEVARVLAAIALGELSALLVGPPGTGKSTLAEYVHRILPLPQDREFRISRQISRYYGEDIRWRPLRRPHHTATVQALVGGGNPPEPGEISRAHGGILLLDELLEFDPVVVEALREPLESGRILVSRAGASREFPARIQCLATTNLCPCGELTMAPSNKCVCRHQKRRQYIQKLSGPLMDRFHLFLQSHTWKLKNDVALTEVASWVQAGSAFAKKQRPFQKTANALRPEREIESSLNDEVRLLYPQKPQSQRRWRSVLHLARTFADIDQSQEIRARHMNEAWGWAVHSFQKFQLEVGKII